MGKYFGTDGFRGEANKALTANKAFQVGRYIGWYYGQRHDDGRASISPSRNNNTFSFLLLQDRRIRLRNHDLRITQSFL